MRDCGIAATFCALFAGAALAGGSHYYATDFYHSERTALDVAGGDLPGRLAHHHGTYPLLVWLQLTGRYTPEHAELFRRYLMPGDGGSGSAERESGDRFAETLRNAGYDIGDPVRWRLLKRVHVEADTTFETVEWVENCRPDAFSVARETFLERRRRYGAGTPELDRWVAAQLAVFEQCSEDRGRAPIEPDSRWETLAQHDRRYQIAAWHFYRQSYLEAAARFGEIGATADSPWHRLARYLVPRSLARHATLVETSETERARYLAEALAGFEGLARDEAYLVDFPSVMNQIMRIRTALGDSAHVGLFERRLLDSPATMHPGEVADYEYLALRWHAVDGRPDEYARWLDHVTGLADDFFHSPHGGQVETAVDRLFAAWRDNRTLPYLYLALGFAGDGTDRADLRALLAQSRDHTPQTPGYAAMFGHRLRVARALGDDDDVRQLKSEAAERAVAAGSRAAANEMRVQVARAASDWPEYLEWASLLPLNVPWSDRYAESLPTDRFNRITSETRLFPYVASQAINALLTPATVVDAVGVSQLSDYQRGRLAIAGWVKALMADDLDTAVDLAPLVARFAPPLAAAMTGFEAAEDRRFEAAWIVLKHPGMSPWIRPGVGRIHRGGPATDRVGVAWSSDNWWCPHGYNPERVAPNLPYYARGMDPDGASTAELPTAAAFFGPHVLRYALENAADPRVPEALHRVVFATRYSCKSGPGRISRAAHAALQKQYPGTEWADKTPYWYE